MTVKMVHYASSIRWGTRPLRCLKVLKEYKSTKTITRIKHGLSAMF